MTTHAGTFNNNCIYPPPPPGILVYQAVHYLMNMGQYTAFESDI